MSNDGVLVDVDGCPKFSTGDDKLRSDSDFCIVGLVRSSASFFSSVGIPNRVLVSMEI